jgi:hypothetical protein
MADIDSIISGVAGNTRYDFSTFGDPVKSYFDAQDRKAKNELRDAFKGGVPTLPDGSIDYSTMQRTLYQKGGLEQGNSLLGASGRAAEYDALRKVDEQPQAQPTVGPSTSRNTVTPDPGKRMDTARSEPASPQGQPSQQPTIMNVVAAQGFPNTELQKISESIARQLGVDPTAPLNLQDPQVRNVLAPAIAQFKRMNLGQVQPGGAAPPQATPQAGQPAPQGAPPVMAQAPQQGAPQAAPQSFQPPPNVVAAQNDPVLKRLTLLAASENKATAAAAKVRLEAYLKNQELTPDQKNAAASGQSLTDYQNRPDENKAQLAVLKDSVLPKLDESQKGATAARDEIQAIHRSREQLDAPGGILSGSTSEVRLKLAKAAELIGVPNADKIANTEAFSAAIGSRVLALVKGLGAGTSISNSDRAFAEKMAGGNINLDEASIRKILDIGERAARSKIDTHNATAGKIIKSNEALKPYADVYGVEAPGQYQRPKGGQSTPSTFSSPADVHTAIAEGRLKKGDTFQDSAGKTRVVP